MISIWSSLVALLYSQYYTKSEGTLVEFWLLRFPFAIHCGWLTAASALNVNVLVVDIGPPAAVQLADGWIYAELQQPRDQIVQRFSADAISGVSYAALAVAIIISMQIAVRAIHALYESFCSNNANTQRSEDTGSDTDKADMAEDV